MRLVGLTLWAIHPRLFVVTSRRIRRRTARLQSDPAALAKARTGMAHMLQFVDSGDAPAGADLDAAARAHIAFGVRWKELRWHPRRFMDQRIVGIENLQRAHAEGHGVLLSFVHHGYFSGMFGAVGREGFHVAVVTAQSAIDAVGPNSMQYLRLIGAGGSVLSADEGMAGLKNRLAQGQVVASAIDVPGRTSVEVAGRPMTWSAGGLVAAARAGAPIIVASSHADGDLSTIHLSEPLHADDFDSIDALAQEVASRQAAAVLSWVEATYLPDLIWRAYADGELEAQKATGI